MDQWTRERYPGLSDEDLERERAGRLRRHPFVWSGQRTQGHRICTCGSRERDSIHRLKPVSEEVGDVEARRVGER